MDPTIIPSMYQTAMNPQSLNGPTPTPQQIQSAYAQANTMKGQGLSTEPVHAWTQGVNQMLKALVGNYQGNRADAMQRQLYGAATIPGGGPMSPGPAPYMPPQTNAPASIWGGTVPFMNAPFSAGGTV